MRSKYWTYIIHISAWLLFFTLPIALRFIFLDKDTEHFSPPPSYDNIVKSQALLYFLFVLVFIIFFYYFNSNVLIIKLLLKRKFLLYALSVFVCYLIFLYSFQTFIGYPKPNVSFSPPPQALKVLSRLMGSLLFLFVLLVSTGIRLTTQWYEGERQRTRIEKEKAEAELSFLKAQINPHFLFNTLNSIYTLALKQSEKTPEAVMHLSNMMRFVTTEAQSNFVSMEQELQYVRHFIDLQKLRMPKNVIVHTVIDCDNDESKIAPLLLMPFIENAFKYGVSMRESATIDISIRVENNVLNMLVQNQKFQAKNEEKDKSGIGLGNTKKRLEMLYKNHYNLIINDLEHFFSVNLELKL